MWFIRGLLRWPLSVLWIELNFPVRSQGVIGFSLGVSILVDDEATNCNTLARAKVLYVKEIGHFYRSSPITGFSDL